MPTQWWTTSTPPPRSGPSQRSSRPGRRALTASSRSMAAATCSKPPTGSQRTRWPARRGSRGSTATTRPSREAALACASRPQPMADHQHPPVHHHEENPMSPEDKIRAGWDDDDQPRSAFPEPLTERLTRDWFHERDCRAAAEARVAELEGALQTSRDNHQGAEEKLNALVADLRGLADGWGDEADRYDGYAVSSSTPQVLLAVAKTLDGDAT